MMLKGFIFSLLLLGLVASGFSAGPVVYFDTTTNRSTRALTSVDNSGNLTVGEGAEALQSITFKTVGSSPYPSISYSDASDSMEISTAVAVAGDLSVTGAITGGSLTDGTATLAAGSATGLVNVTASGTVGADSLYADSIANEAGTGAPTLTYGTVVSTGGPTLTGTATQLTQTIGAVASKVLVVRAANADGEGAPSSNPTTGTNNECFGSLACEDSHGSSNTAAGSNSLRLAPGSSNTAAGYASLYQSPGSSNTAAGYNSLRQSSGSNNTSAGYNSLYLSPGSSNTAAGVNSLRLSPGSSNTSAGSNSLYLSPGSFNTSAGVSSLSQSPGSNNTSAGVTSLYLSPGSNNTSAGVNSLREAPGSNNSVFGYHALDPAAQRTINRITAVGALAAENLTTGAADILALGYAAGHQETNGTNKAYIGGWNGSTQYPLDHHWEVSTVDSNNHIDPFTVNRVAYKLPLVDSSGLLQVDEFTSNPTAFAENFYVGTDAGDRDPASRYNTAVGYTSLYQSPGTFNTTTGYYSLRESTGSNNTASGAYSLNASNGSNNTAAGVNSLRSSAGSNNTAAGSYSLYQSAGNGNTAVGYTSLRSSPGSFNTAAGVNSLLEAPGSYNTAAGVNSLYQSPGSNNTASGYSSLYNASGSNNIAVGYAALYKAPGSNNTVVGLHTTVATPRTVNRITALGALAADNLTTGALDILALGYAAGNTATNETNRVYIGGWSGSTQYPLDHHWEVSTVDSNNHIDPFTVNRVAYKLPLVDSSGLLKVDSISVAGSSSISASVQTLDATPDSSMSYTIGTGNVALVKVKVVAQVDAGAPGDTASYIRECRVENTAGTVSVHDVSASYTSEDQAAWDVTLVGSGAAVAVEVTGAAVTTINWTATWEVVEL